MEVAASEEDADRKVAALKVRKINATVSRRKTKIAFRKMARFFGLTLPQIGDTGTDVQIMQLGKNIVKIEKGRGFTGVIYQDEDFNIIKAEYTITVTAPSGASMVGVGACSVEERKFNSADHNIPATAWTRALNRAIADLIGWGEVSAEEIVAQPNNSAVDAEFVEVDDNRIIKNTAQFMAECSKVGIPLSELNKMTDVIGDVGDIKDFDAAFEKVKKAKGIDEPENVS